MLKNTLIASATAGLIALGALAATPSTASATNYGHGYGNGYSLQFGNNGIRFGYRAPQYRRVCKPIFRRAVWHDRYGRPHYQRVKVGVKCNRNRGPQSQNRRPRGNNGFYFRFGF